MENIETMAVKKFNWINFLFLSLTPLVSLLMGVLYVSKYGLFWSDFFIFLLMYFLTGLAVTAGYHRFYSHRSFVAHPVLEMFFLLFGAASFQNSALAWSSDHRYHHRYVDKEADPYNIKKGFLWAHILWIFFVDATDRPYSNVQDLKKNRWIVWQHRYYFPLAIIVGFGFPALLGALVSKNWIAGLLWGGFVRIVFVHHCTFLINSAAHVFGTQPYSEQTSAKDSWWLAFFSYGEGYHNFHHSFPSDYRNGVAWFHWDPTKWFIWTASKLGLARQLKRTKLASTAVQIA